MVDDDMLNISEYKDVLDGLTMGLGGVRALFVN